MAKLALRYTLSDGSVGYDRTDPDHMADDVRVLVEWNGAIVVEVLEVPKGWEPSTKPTA